MRSRDPRLAELPEAGRSSLGPGRAAGTVWGSMGPVRSAWLCSALLLLAAVAPEPGGACSCAPAHPQQLLCDAALGECGARDGAAAGPAAPGRGDRDSGSCALASAWSVLWAQAVETTVLFSALFFLLVGMASIT